MPYDPTEHDDFEKWTSDIHSFMDEFRAREGQIFRLKEEVFLWELAASRKLGFIQQDKRWTLHDLNGNLLVTKRTKVDCLKEYFCDEMHAAWQENAGPFHPSYAR